MAGDHTMLWHLKDNKNISLNTGTYFISLSTNETKINFKLSVIK